MIACSSLSDAGKPWPGMWSGIISRDHLVVLGMEIVSSLILFSGETKNIDDVGDINMGCCKLGHRFVLMW